MGSHKEQEQQRTFSVKDVFRTRTSGDNFPSGSNAHGPKVENMPPADRNPNWDTLSTQILQEQDTGRANLLAHRTLAMHAAKTNDTLNNGQVDKRTLKSYEQIYSQLTTEVRRSHIEPTPEFAQAVYTKVLPILLGVNRIGRSFNGSEGNNSMQQIVATALRLLSAERVKKTGGKLIIFGQMCAQYDSGENRQDHTEASFARDLLHDLDPDKVTRTMMPLRQIAEVCESVEIPVNIVLPQVSPDDARLMAAMVPATVWQYVQQNRVNEMLTTLHRHQVELPPLMQRGLGIDTEATRKIHLETPSYAMPDERGFSIIGATFKNCQLFEQITGVLQEESALRRGIIPEATSEWHTLTPRGVKRLQDCMDIFNDRGEMYPVVREKYNWTDEDIATFKAMYRSLSIEGWGAMDDTAKFYSREVQRRTGSQASEWQRKLDYDREITGLLNNPDFYPEHLGHTEGDRLTKARSLLRGVDLIANMGIGGRAIFNVSLYAAIGQRFTDYNDGQNVGIMWPLEEDSDRWAIDIMQQTWNNARTQEGMPKTIPCVYPKKELRQPFNK